VSHVLGDAKLTTRLKTGAEKSLRLVIRAAHRVFRPTISTQRFSPFLFVTIRVHSRFNSCPFAVALSVGRTAW
jgi:hypothetical protein